MPETPHSKGVTSVEALYFSGTNSQGENRHFEVVQEDALTLDIEDVGRYALMWTPTFERGAAQGFTLEDGLLGEEEQPDGLALALGFIFSEGLISALDDIVSLSTCPDEPAVVNVRLRSPETVVVSRKDVVVNSSCGICGPGEILDDNVLQLPHAKDTLRLPRTLFEPLVEQMRQQQAIFDQTGGTHAAAIFDQQGRVIAVAEDLGRHNALDKALGLVLLKGGDPSRCGVVLSSRLSLEMVLKAVRTGLQIMIAVSAPTSLAIEVAQKYGITLCGFVRDGRATIYTHSQRITTE